MGSFTSTKTLTLFDYKNVGKFITADEAKEIKADLQTQQTPNPFAQVPCVTPPKKNK